MQVHRKRPATTPGDEEDRPQGRVSGPLGASDALTDEARIAGARPPAERAGNAICWVPYV